MLVDGAKVLPATVSRNLDWFEPDKRLNAAWRKPDDAAAGGRSQARYWHGALRHRHASCQQRACLASSKVSRFVTPAVPPTGADANEFYWVSAPNVVPFVVTNRTEYEIAPVVCR
jgi:hypothetical protein